jgi:HSP20 family protein
LIGQQTPDADLPFRLMSLGGATRGHATAITGEARVTMNALTRLDRFEDLMPEFFRRISRPLAVAEAGDIRVDVTENDKDYQVRAEIPGAKKEDMRVHVDGNFVSISAEVKKTRKRKRRARSSQGKATSVASPGAFRWPTRSTTRPWSPRSRGVLKADAPKREGSGPAHDRIQ